MTHTVTPRDPAVRAQAGEASAPRGSGDAVHSPRSARAGWERISGSPGGAASAAVEVVETGASSSAQATPVVV